MDTQELDALDDFFFRQTERLRKVLRRKSQSERLARRQQIPTRREIIRDGQTESRGNVCHAQGAYRDVA